MPAPAEYIHAALLFADIDNSVMFSSTLTPEAYDSFIQNFQECAAKLQSAMMPGPNGLPEIRNPYGENLLSIEQYILGDQLALFIYDKEEVARNQELDDVDNPPDAQRALDLKARCRLSNQKAAFQALLAAVYLKNVWLEAECNRERFENRREPYGLAVGLHFGRVMYRKRYNNEYRIEGYNVNYAKRIEGLGRIGKYSNIMLSKRMRDLICGLQIRRYQGRQFLHFEEYKPQPDHMKGIIGELPIYELKAFTRLEEDAKIPEGPISLYEKIASLNKDNLWAHNLVFDHYLSRKASEVYLPKAQRAHDFAPNDEQVMLNLAKAYFYNGFLDYSHQLALRAIDIDPQFYGGYSWLAKIAFERKDHQAQLHWLGKELAFCPRSAIVHMNIAGALFRLGAIESNEEKCNAIFSSAKAAFDEAVALYSKYPERLEVQAELRAALACPKLNPEIRRSMMGHLITH